MKEAYKQKQIIIDEIKDKFERAESAVVIDYMVSQLLKLTK